MSNAEVRLGICGVLFAVWIALVVFQVQGDGQIIDVIKYTLAMLGGYHAGDRINVQPISAPAVMPSGAATSNQSGFARLPVLIVMAVVSLVVLAGCATNCGTDRQCAKENAEDIGAGIGVALDVLAIPAEVDPPTVTTTRTCTSDRFGDQSCTTTKQGY